MNINGVSANIAACCMDSEYARIIRELRAYGIEPSGNKSTDKMKLEQIKQAKRQDNIQQPQAVEKSGKSEKESAISSEDTVKAQMEQQAQQMSGATQVANLNKYKLLGLF